MIKMNMKMKEALQGLHLDNMTLRTELSSLLFGGFVLRNCCVLLASLAGFQTNASLENFPDKTGYECFINSIHIDDYVHDEYLANACLFVEALFDIWRQSRNDGTIQAIVSSDEYGAVVRFHLVRKNESWISTNIESYEEAILVVYSSIISKNHGLIEMIASAEGKIMNSKT